MVLLQGDLLTLWRESENVFDHRLVRSVWRPFVRQNPCHACLTGGVIELYLGLCWCVTAQRDDLRILASECLDECLRFAVIDRLGDHSVWQLVLAVDACDGRDGVFASLEQGFGHAAAAVAASLRLSVDELQASG